MSKWTFFGAVFPERVPINWSTPLAGRTELSSQGVQFEFRVIIHLSQAIIDLTILEGAPHVFAMRDVAANCVTIITDLIGWRHGSSFTVDITSARCRDNDEWYIFGNNIPLLAERHKNDEQGTVDTNLVQLVGGSVAAQMVLADFREAIRNPLGTGFFCYRAIEAMMQSIKSDAAEKESHTWARFREMLRVERSALDYLKRHADFPRHGKPSHITDEERGKVFALTDELIGRYLQYLLRGSIVLPLSEFPPLTA